MSTAVEKMSRSVTIAHMAMEGVKSSKIAKDLGISKRTVYRDLETKQAKEILQQAQQIAILSAIPIQERFIKLTESDDESIRLAAIKQWHKIMGYSPSAINNVYINKIVQDNRQQIIHPEVAKALSGHQESIIDAEVVQ